MFFAILVIVVNPLSAKFIKWSNTLKQIVGKLPTICLSVFDHFSGLALKGLIKIIFEILCGGTIFYNESIELLTMFSIYPSQQVWFHYKDEIKFL